MWGRVSKGGGGGGHCTHRGIDALIYAVWDRKAPLHMGHDGLPPTYGETACCFPGVV